MVVNNTQVDEAQETKIEKLCFLCLLLNVLGLYAFYVPPPPK
jgi:hypothetical protein